MFATEAEYYVPIEHHNPMEPFASTVTWDGGGKLTVYDKTQGVQNVQRYVCGIFDLKPEDVRVVSLLCRWGIRLRAAPAISGGAGRAGGARAGALGSSRSDAPADVLARLPPRHDPADRTGCDDRRNARCDHARRDHGDVAIRGLPSARDHLVRLALQKSPTRTYAHKLARLDLSDVVRHARAQRCDWRLCARMRDGRARGRAQARSAGAALAVLFGSRPATTDLPFSSKDLRECYRQGAEAFGWDKRNPEPRSMRDGSELVGWGMATGVWEALQMPITVRIVLTANGHAEVACATSDIGTGTYTIMAQVAADMLGLPLDNISIKLGDFDAAAIPGGRWIVDRGVGVKRNRDDRQRGPRASCCVWRSRCRSRRSRMPTRDEVALVDGKLVSKQDASHAVSIADAMRHGGVDRIEQEKTTTSFADGQCSCA